MNEIVGITRKLKIKIIIAIVLCLGIVSGLFVMYGPVPIFREWLITTAMTTMNHQYLATWFYSDETIQEVLDKNKVVEIAETTDPNLVTMPTVVELENEKKEEVVYENEYEKAVLENPNNEDYKIIEINGDTYSGYLAVIYDPSRVKVATTENIGKEGQFLTTISKKNNALVAINGGGFDDPSGKGNGSTPIGTTIANGKIITSYQYASSSGGLIGFTNENKLVLGKMTAKEAIKMGVRDAVTFGPFLIVNGKTSQIVGNGGWGNAPRTAIGQRQDGIVLFLVLDGRTLKRPGANMKDLTEIMQRYGAYNAANLDGGTSSAMVVNNEVINDPVDSSGKHRTRAIATGFLLLSK